MIDGRIVDGLVGALITIGALIGLGLGMLIFVVIPWLYNHLSIEWHP